MGFSLFLQRFAAILTAAVFILTFFIFFRESRELLSSFFAAILSVVLTLGALIILNWVAKALK